MTWRSLSVPGSEDIGPEAKRRQLLQAMLFTLAVVAFTTSLLLSLGTATRPTLTVRVIPILLMLLAGAVSFIRYKRNCG